METKLAIQRRIRSAENISQIARTMEMVAALKMRKVQELTLASRPYALAALRLLATLSEFNADVPELFKVRTKIQKELFVLIASDRGLAGAFNSKIFRTFEQYLESVSKSSPAERVFLAVGRKSAGYLARKGYRMEASFVHVGDYTALSECAPLAEYIADGYVGRRWDKVHIISAHFKTALVYQCLARQVLPVEFGHITEIIKKIIPETGKFSELIKKYKLDAVPGKQAVARYTIEPSPAVVLRHLARHLLTIQIYDAILEANASEHSARRAAMQTASDNAKELSSDLRLKYHKLRQAQITTEIIEVTSGQSLSA